MEQSACPVFVASALVFSTTAAHRYIESDTWPPRSCASAAWSACTIHHLKYKIPHF